MTAEQCQAMLIANKHITIAVVREDLPNEVLVTIQQTLQKMCILMDLAFVGYEIFQALDVNEVKQIQKITIVMMVLGQREVIALLLQNVYESIHMQKKYVEIAQSLVIDVMQKMILQHHLFVNVVMELSRVLGISVQKWIQTEYVLQMNQ